MRRFAPRSASVFLFLLLASAPFATLAAATDETFGGSGPSPSDPAFDGPGEGEGFTADGGFEGLDGGDLGPMLDTLAADGVALDGSTGLDVGTSLPGALLERPDVLDTPLTVVMDKLFEMDKGDGMKDPSPYSKGFSEYRYPIQQTEPFQKGPQDYVCPDAKYQAAMSISIDLANCILNTCLPTEVGGLGVPDPSPGGELPPLGETPPITVNIVPPDPDDGVPCLPSDCVILPGAAAETCAPKGICDEEFFPAILDLCSSGGDSAPSPVTPGPGLERHAMVTFLSREKSYVGEDEVLNVTIGILPLKTLHDVRVTATTLGGLTLSAETMGPAQLDAGETQTYTFSLVGSAPGEYEASFVIQAFSEGKFVLDRQGVRFAIDASGTRAEVKRVIYEETQKYLTPSASSMSVASEPASLTQTTSDETPPAGVSEARDRHVVFVHGIDDVPGNSTDGGPDDSWNELSNTMYAYWGWDITQMAHAGFYQCDGPGVVGSDPNALANYNIPRYLNASNYPTVALPATPHDGHNTRADPPGPAFDNAGGHADASDPQDDDCAPFDGHNENATIAHLGYHLAWAVAETYGPTGTFPGSVGGATGTCVDVIAHGMGALIVRYALQQAEYGDAEFPSWLCLRSVVSLGGPHSGWQGVCSAKSRQCAEMEAGSALLSWSSVNARDPASPGAGTDWTLISAYGDTLVPPASGAAVSCIPDPLTPSQCIWQSPTDMDPQHTSVYTSSTIGSDNYVTGSRLDPLPGTSVRNMDTAWRAGGRPDCSATFGYPCDSITLGPSVGRNTEMSSAYELWGCGGNSATDAWYIEYDHDLVGQPYYDTYVCTYRVNVPSGSPNLVVQMQSPSGDERDVWVHQSLSDPHRAECDVVTSSATEQCTIPTPAAGSWYIHVDPKGSTQPFTLRVQEAVANDLTGVFVYQAPESVVAGTLYTVCWLVTGSGTISSAELRWGMTAASQPNLGPAHTGTAPATYSCDTLTAPLSGTSFFIVGHAVGPNDNLWTSPAYEIEIEPQNDCYTNQDAGPTQPGAAPITMPILGCPGELPTGDVDDYYRVTVPAGEILRADMTPNPDSDFDVCLYDPLGVEYCSTGAALGGMESISATSMTAGTWHVKVHPFAGQPGPYSLTVFKTTQNDCGSGDGGPNFASASTRSAPALGSCSGSLPSGDMNDFFRVNLPNGAKFRLSMRPAGGADFELCVYNPSQVQIACSNAGAGLTEGITFTTTGPGNHYIRVARWSGAGGYSITMAAGAENDCNVGTDAGNTWAAASFRTIPTGTCSGFIASNTGAASIQDWFKFTTGGGVGLTVTLAPNGGANFDVCIYNPATNTVFQCSTSPGSGVTDSMSVVLPGPGDWRVLVYPFAGWGTYTLSISAAALQQNDCDSGGDAPSSSLAAGAMLASPITTPCGGNLPTSESTDQYRFNAAAAQTITLQMNPNSGSNFNICLFRPDLTLAKPCTTTGGTGQADTVNMVATHTGVWMAQINRVTGSGLYTLTLTVDGTPANDCGTGDDASNAQGPAAVLLLPVPTCTGTLFEGDVRDYYRFNVPVGRIVYLTLQPGGGADFDLCLRRPDTTVAHCSSLRGVQDSVDFAANVPGSWAAEIYPHLGTGSYAFSAELIVANDCMTGADAGDSLAAGSLITPPQNNCQGMLPNGDIGDHYRFAVAAGATINAAMQPGGGADFDLCLYDPSGAEVACSTYHNGQQEGITIPALTGGTWTARVYRYVGSGYYQMAVNLVPPNDCDTGADAGNAFAGSPLSLPQTLCEGRLPYGDPSDYYSFPVTIGQAISLDLMPTSGADFDLCLYTDTGALATCSMQRSGLAESIVYSATSTGTWSLRVYVYSGAGVYSLTARLQSPNDCYTGGDASASLSFPTTLTLPRTTCPASLHNGDAADIYAFSVTTGQTINAIVQPNAGADFDVCLFAPSATTPIECSYAYTGQQESITRMATVTGSWRLRAIRNVGTGPYDLTLNLVDPNDCGTFQDAGSFASGPTITPINGCPGRLPNGDAEDVFRFNANGDQSVRLSLAPNAGANFDLCLLDPAGNQRSCSQTWGNGVSESIDITATSTGLWGARVYRIGGTGDYTFSLALVAPNDCLSGGDAGNTFAAATLRTLPLSTCPGTLPNGDSEDYYKFDVAAGQTVDVSVQPQGTPNFNICLIDPATQQATDCSYSGAGQRDNVNRLVTTSGQWVLRVYKYAGHGSYTLTATKSGTPSDDCNTGDDAGSNLNAATAITLPVTTCTGTLPNWDVGDFYAYTGVAGKAISVRLQPNGGANFDLCVYPSSGTQECSTNGLGQAETILMAMSVAGTWRIEVRPRTGAGQYTLSVDTAVHDDCNTGADAGNAFTTPTALGLPANNCAGLLPRADAQDVYSFSVTSGQTVNLNLQPSAGTDFDLCLITPSNGYYRCSNFRGAAQDSVIETVTLTGTWKAVVLPYAGSGSYRFSASLVSPDDCNTGWDAANDFAAAPLLPNLASNCQATMPNVDPADYYKFDVVDGETIDVRVAPNAGLAVSLCLFNQAGASQRCIYGTPGQQLSMVRAATSTGQWRVAVGLRSGSGPYAMSIGLADPNDCNTGVDAGDALAAATPIPTPVINCNAALPDADVADNYQFTVVLGQTINVDLQPNSGANFDVCVYTPAGAQAACGTAGSSGRESLSIFAGTGGTWKVHVFTSYASSGAYTLSVELRTQNDCGSGGDAANTFASGASIAPVVGCPGAMPIGDRDDFYRFTVSPGQVISVDLRPNAGANFDLCVLNPSGTVVQPCGTQGAGLQESLAVLASTGGVWGVQAYTASGSGQYELSVQLAPANDCNTGSDAANAFSAAPTPTIAVPMQGCTGGLASGDPEDHYRFSVTSGTVVTVRLLPNMGANFDLCLLNPSGGQVQCSNYGKGQSDAVTYTATTAGFWGARVYQVAGGGQYTLQVLLEPQNDCDSGVDGGNTLASATAIPQVSGCQGWLPNGDPDDHFKFSVGAGATINVYLHPAGSANFDLCLFNPSGTQVACSTQPAGHSETILAASVAGDWTARVRPVSGSGTYSFSAYTQPADDCHTGADASNTFAGGQAIYVPVQYCRGVLSVGDSHDYYRFSATAGETLQLTLQSPYGANFDLCLMNPSGGQARCSTYGTGYQDFVSQFAGQGGLWGVYVQGLSGSGEYWFTVEKVQPNDCGSWQEAGTTISTAVPISTQTWGCGGTLPMGDPGDWFSFPVTVGQTINAELLPNSGANFNLCVINPSGQQVSGGCSYEPQGQRDFASVFATQSGTWAIAVSPSSGAGVYSITLYLENSNDCNSGADAGNSNSAATALNLAASCRGGRPSGDPLDAYRFSATAGQTIDLVLRPDQGVNLNICLYNPSGGSAGCSSSGGSGQAESLSVFASAGGTWVAVVDGPGYGGYRVELDLVNQDDCYTGGDAGNSHSTAVQIYNSYCYGALPSGDMSDHFKFSGTSGQTVNVNLQPNAADFDLCLYKPSGALAGTCSHATGSQRDSLSFLADETGNWVAKVYWYSGSGGYTFWYSLENSNDCGSGTEASGSTSGAPTLYPSVYCSGTLPTGDTGDVYAVYSTDAQVINAELYPNGGANFEVCILNPSGSVMGGCSSAGVGQRDYIARATPVTGTYFVKVQRTSGSGSYDLNLWHTTAPQNDCGSGTDADTYYGITIGSSGSCQGALPTGDGADLFAFWVGTAGSTVTSTLYPPSGADFDLYLYDYNTGAWHNNAVGGSTSETVTRTVGSAGWWGIYVDQWSGSGTYTISRSVTTPPPPNDCATGVEASNSFPGTSKTMSFSGCTGSITSGDTDHYRFTNSLVNGQSITLTMTPQSGVDLELCLVNPSGGDAQCSYAGTSQTEHITWTVDTPGNWGARIWGFNGHTGTYTFSASVTAAPAPSQNDCNSNGDASNSEPGTMMHTSSYIPQPFSCSGQLPSGDNNDYYRYNVHPGESVTKTLTFNSGSNFKLCVRDNANAWSCWANSSDTWQQYNLSSATSTLQHIRVERVSGTGSYTLQVTCASAPC